MSGRLFFPALIESTLGARPDGLTARGGSQIITSWKDQRLRWLQDVFEHRTAVT